MEQHAIQNFQIPVEDFERARNFYSILMDYEMEIMEFQGVKPGVFRSDSKNGVGGTIIHGGDQKPTKEGTMVFLHCGDDLAPHLSRMKETEGSISHLENRIGPRGGDFMRSLTTRKETG